MHQRLLKLASLLRFPVCGGGTAVLRVSPSTFAIVANGFADGPAQALRDYLIARGATVVTVLHPLTPENGSGHVVATYAGGRQVDERTVRLPLRPPLSFVLDPFIPLLPPRVDGWFGFNPLACARGLIAPDRFGRGTLATRLYDRLDCTCCTRADSRIELSEAARDARDRRHGLRPDTTRTHVVPMGAWVDRVPTTPRDGFRHRRVVFLGHLVPPQGVDVLLEALSLLRTRGEKIFADVIGTGPLEANLRERATALGLDDVVRFHGFVRSHRDVERILAGSSIGVAPYRPEGDTFKRYADPGKLKAYLATGLPVVLTDVPPNADELVREAGAEIVRSDAASIADGIVRSLESPARWGERRRASLAYARRFDWAVLLGDVLGKLGFRFASSSAAGH